MSAVVDFVSDVVEDVFDFAGDVVEGIGDAVDWVVEEVVQPVVDTVGKTIEAAMNDPIGTIAKVATAVYAPALLPLTNAAVTLAHGGDLGDAMKSAAVAYVAPEVGKMVGASVAPEFGAEFAKVAGNAAASATGAALSGGDPLQALLSGGVTAATPILTSQIPGFSELAPAAQRTINAAIGAELSGRDAGQAAINSALSVGMNMATEYIQDAFKEKTLPQIEAGEPGQYDFKASYDLFSSSGGNLNEMGGAQGITAPKFGGEDYDLGSFDYEMWNDMFGSGEPGLTTANTPNIKGMGGAQGIVVPVEGGYMTEQGFIPDNYSQLETGSLGQGVGGIRLTGQGGERSWFTTPIAGMVGNKFLAPTREQVAQQLNVPERSLSDLTDEELAQLVMSMYATPGEGTALGEETEYDYKANKSDYSDVPFGKAFAQARMSGNSEFTWNGAKYNTMTAEEAAGQQAGVGAGGGRGGQGGPTAEQFLSQFAEPSFTGSGRGGQGGPTAEQFLSQFAPTFGGSGRGGQGGPTAEEYLSQFAPTFSGSGRGGQGGATADELAAYLASSGAAPQKDQFGEQVSLPEYDLAKYFDMTRTPYPQALAFAKGLMGTAPDQLGYSVLQDNTEGIRSAGEAGFGLGTALQVAPVLSKGVQLGAQGIEALLGASKAAPVASKFVNAAQATEAYYPQINNAAAVFTPQSRQMGNLITELAGSPTTSTTALKGALDAMNAGDANSAFKMLLQDPTTRGKALQILSGKGYTATTPFYSPSGQAGLSYLSNALVK